ncbi:putative ISW2-ATPase component of a two subunit chromatin remodeling complex [Jaminaea rosea]|uniref:Putative ISW2-ATPase component of a two subunit chromatin remodeling complex n=1 Tax=Jaminaea rosea TaxID=1569628 RepID=A0A316UV74_9BASI|nr:putative ISW2-ATPase component of a two subunit chromatin remodeling complex [Jaminaea rosea]PWN29206.1 putative ISW2-ATPase component of a two subunit chromatin remodeling complex [Jaminaea rosea]
MSRPLPKVEVSGAPMDEDKLSDYIPQSGDLSRQPTASASVSRVQSKAPSEEDEQEDSEDEVMDDDEDGANTSNAKPSQSREEFRKKKAAQASDLSSTRAKQNSRKVADSMKRFTYLLGQTELFQHFIDIKKDRDPEFAKLLEESTSKLNAKKAGKGRRRGGAAAAKDSEGGSRRRKTEKEEDEELLQDNDDDEEQFVFHESPPYVKGGTMRDYQIQGLNWMISLYHNGINGILADEMGLGKTLQTISFLGWLREFKDTRGLHLVVVPKSTLDNWRREFEKWVPGFKVVVLQGTREERDAIIQNTILPQDLDVLLTTYEMCLREKSALKKLSWEYIVIDEAHRIKNVDSMLSQIVRAFSSRSRLLITGTPLQNNLMELWALLNFLLPDVFSSAEDFESWFKDKGEESQDQVVQQLHKVLRPFLLRRVKADVEKSLLPKKEVNVFVGLTDMQRKWYKSILEKDIDAVNGAGGKKEGKTRLLNIVMQLRKCCNHPYLFDGAEPGPPFTTDEHLVFNSGKMVILDKLLKSMKAKGSRVLIFSQMSRVLDILEDYCFFREYEYCRIDGSTAHEDRIAAIDEYNKEGSEKFVFLLTTRAGGLGINLTTADIVVLFDSDWNPQADLQAMDRAHRIGQTKQVYVFRFVTDKSIEERILERAAQKLRLDQLVIQQGRAQPSKNNQSKDDLVEMIQHGAEAIISAKGDMTIDDDIDEIIKRGEQRTEQLQDKYKAFNLDELNSFQSGATAYDWEGENFQRPGGASGSSSGIRGLWIEPSKRERKTNYSVDAYYKEAMRVGTKPAVKAPRAPKQISINDWQFYPAKLGELQARETAAYQRSIGYKVPAREVKEGESAEEVEEERQREQEFIATAEPLTEEEEKEKEDLALRGFTDWNRRDFQHFIRGAEKYGRISYANIALEVETKTEKEVREYGDVFWRRYTELADWQRLIERIDAGEEKRRKVAQSEELLRKRVNTPGFTIPYANANKSKTFDESEDLFILQRLSEYGLSEGAEVYDRIKKDIGTHGAFRWDWFIKSRTAAEIARRSTTLLGLLNRDAGGADEESAPKANGGGAGWPKGKKRKDLSGVNGDAGSANSSRASTPAVGKGGAKKARKSAT